MRARDAHGICHHNLVSSVHVYGMPRVHVSVTLVTIREEKDRAYSRSELPGRYTAKVLYGWDDRKFEKEYLEKLKRNWRKWKGRKFFWRKNLKRGGNVMN